MNALSVKRIANPMPDKIRRLVVRILLALSCIIPFMMIWAYLAPRALPWWGDTGEWLKYANALEADVALRLGLATPDDVYSKLVPMWDQGAWQYPPLVFILLSLMMKLLDPVSSLKLLGALILSLQPLPAFLLARRMAKSDFAGLLAAYGSSATPLYVEMMGWGGYPNLLGFLLMGFTFHSILRASENPSKRVLVMVVTLSVLLTLTHHLTFVIYVGALILWTLLMTLFERGDGQFKWHGILTGLSSAMASFLLYRITLAWPHQYTLYNEAAYYGLRFEPVETVPWVFKEAPPLIAGGLIILAMFFGIKWALDKRYLTLLFAWSAFPCMATLGFLVGITVDYNRVFFFAIQPVMVLMATPVALIHNPERSVGLTPLFRTVRRTLDSVVPFGVNYRRLGAYVLIALSILASLSSFKVGLATIGNVDAWYDASDPYGDREKLSALMWISRNTLPNETFVSEELMARWIEGFGERRVYLYSEPRFLFIEGQLERHYVASSILKSNYEARNCYVRVLDQAPHNPALSPQIHYWNRGQYLEALRFDDSAAVIRASLNGNPLIFTSFSRANATASTIGLTEGGAVIEATYENPFVKLDKSVFVAEDTPRVVVKYTVSPLNSSIALQNATFTAIISFERSIRLIEAGSGWARFVSDIGTIRVKAQNAEVTADPKTMPTKGIHITFDRGVDGSVRGVVEVSILDVTARRCASKLLAHSREVLLEKNNVSYIVLPRLASETAGEVKTFDVYQHLLDDRGLKVAYLNDRVIILGVRE
ncbi:MAG: hypothetical protein ACE5GD_01040 [Candidatus Geothermarchaeales archaeon]